MSTVSEHWDSAADYEGRTYDLPADDKLFPDRTPPSGDEHDARRKLKRVMLEPDLCVCCVRESSAPDSDFCSQCLRKLRKVD